MDGDWKGEGTIPSLSFQVIKKFGGLRVFEWEGMIQEDLKILTEV
jgi:hypothetical protein